MALTEFSNKWISLKRVDYDKIFGYQCVDLIKQYLHELYGLNPGGWGDAKDYWEHTNPAILTKFSKQQPPVKPGDIVVVKPTRQFPKGHIGIAVFVTPSTVGLLEQNGGSGSGNGLGTNAIRIRTINNNEIYGLLRPKVQEEVKPMSVVRDGDTFNYMSALFDRAPTQAELDKNRGKEWNNPDPKLRAPLYDDMIGRGRYLTEENKRLQKLVDAAGSEAKLLPPGKYLVN